MKTKIARKKAIEGYLFISPWLIGLTVFIIGPIITTFILSFTDWPVIASPQWIGLRNYFSMKNDPDFWLSLGKTSYYVVASVPLGVICSLGVALLLNQKIWGKAILRTIYYLPAVVSGVAMAMVWRWLFHPEFGAINYILSRFWIKGPKWLLDENWAMIALIIMSITTIGPTMIIFLAGLQNIPQHLYEAAESDGANLLQKFWYITLPMVSPTIFFNLVMGVIASFQVFTQIYVMTQGGPGKATFVYVLYLYVNGFKYYRMGYACALAWILFVIILVCTLLLLYSSGKWVYYEGK